MEMSKLAGVYLVIDPKQDWKELFSKLVAALKGGVSILQIWDHWHDDIGEDQKLEFIQEVKKLAKPWSVPVLMHDDWRFALTAELEGVHFDVKPENFESVRQQLEGKYIGLTVGNDLELIRWADRNELSYISFCAVFPSPSVDTCEIVSHSTIKETQNITDMPIFLSGGITINNLQKLNELPFDGVAVISGILSSKEPTEAVKHYIKELKKLNIVS